MTPGAALLLMTDADDPRPDSAVAPSVPPASGVSVHVRRCAACRGQKCAGSTNKRSCEGVKEGWLARTKVNTPQRPNPHAAQTAQPPRGLNAPPFGTLPRARHVAATRTLLDATCTGIVAAE